MTAREAAEARKVRARLSLDNAIYHARGVGRRFGAWSPEHVVARAVVTAAEKELLEACTALVPLYAVAAT